MESKSQKGLGGVSTETLVRRWRRYRDLLFRVRVILHDPRRRGMPIEMPRWARDEWNQAFKILPKVTQRYEEASARLAQRLEDEARARGESISLFPLVVGSDQAGVPADSM